MKYLPYIFCLMLAALIIVAAPVRHLDISIVHAQDSGDSGDSGGDSNSTDSSGYSSNEEAGGAIGSSYSMANGSTVTASSDGNGGYTTTTVGPAGTSFSCTNGTSIDADGNITDNSKDGVTNTGNTTTTDTVTTTTVSNCGYVYGVSGWQYTCNMTDACPAGFGLANGRCVALAVCSSSDPSASCSCPTGYQYTDTYQNVCTRYACNWEYNSGACASWYCSRSVSVEHQSCTFTSCPSGYTQESEGVGVISVCVSGVTSQTSCVSQNLCGTDGNLYHESSNCAISTSPVQTCQYGCTGSTCTLPSAPKVVTFSLAPSLVATGKSTVISWNVANATNCTVTGSNNPPDTWTQPSGAESWTGSQTSSLITGQTIYTLHCTPISGAQNADGSAATWTDQTATVNIVPVFHEQ